MADPPAGQGAASHFVHPRDEPVTAPAELPFDLFQPAKSPELREQRADGIMSHEGSVALAIETLD